jgi:hypothetical protein
MECVYCAVRTKDLTFRSFFKGLTLIAGEFEACPLDLRVSSSCQSATFLNPLTAIAVSRWHDRTNVTFCTVYTARDIASLNKAISGAEGR